MHLLLLPYQPVKVYRIDMDHPVEVQYFDKYFHRSPVFWDLEFSLKSSIFSQNLKSKIPIVDYLGKIEYLFR